MAKIDPGRGRLKAVKDDGAGDTVSADQITSSTDEILESINRQISSEAGSVLDEPDWVRNAQDSSARSIPDGGPPALKAIPGFAPPGPDPTETDAAAPDTAGPEPEMPDEPVTRRPEPLVSPLSTNRGSWSAGEDAETPPPTSDPRDGLMSPEAADAVSNVFSVAARTFDAHKAEREAQDDSSADDAAQDPAGNRAGRPSLTVVDAGERREPVFGRSVDVPETAAGNAEAEPDSLAARALEAALANDGQSDRARDRSRRMVTPRPLDPEARPGLVERGLRAVGVARSESDDLSEQDGDGQVRPWLIRTGIVALPVIFVALGGLMALLFYQARVSDAETGVAGSALGGAAAPGEQTPADGVGQPADAASTAAATLAADAIERAEAERLAAEQAAAEQRAAAEAAQAERAAAEERAAVERAKAEKAAADERAAAQERVRAERSAAEERARAEKAKVERAAAEKRAQAERAKAERARAERARAERAAAEERAKADRAAAERARAETAAAVARAKAERAKAAAAARAPVLQTANAAGAAGTPIPLAISAAPVDPKQSLAVRLTGLPSGTVLSAGSRNSDGSWTVEPDDLAGLTLTPPKSYAGRFAMQVAMMKGGGTAGAGDSRTMAVLVAKSPEARAAAARQSAQVQTFKADGVAKIARAVGTAKPDRSADAAALSDRLIARGDQLMGLGDVASARLMYEHAATNGSAKAATAAGTTYDPVVFAQLGLRSRADPEKAAAWYKKGNAGGDRVAAERLSAMRRWLKANK